jgi:hypothetical protein
MPPPSASPRSHRAGSWRSWAFYATLGSPVDVYIKIGLHQNQVTLNLFSIHIDRSGELGAAIAAYQSKKRRN